MKKLYKQCLALFLSIAILSIVGCEGKQSNKADIKNARIVFNKGFSIVYAVKDNKMNRTCYVYYSRTAGGLHCMDDSKKDN